MTDSGAQRERELREQLPIALFDSMAPADSAAQYAQRIGSRLRRTREAAGLTLRELAAQVGLRDHTVLLKYERGKTAPTITRLHALAQALGVTPAALLAAHDEAVALIAAIDTADQERREQLAFFFTALDEPPLAPPDADTL